MGSARTVVVAALATLVAAPAALAEPGAAVVVVVESLDRAAEPAAIRAALEAEGIPTLSLLDEGAGDADETVTIAIPADGRSARVRLRVGDAVSERVLQRREATMQRMASGATRGVVAVAAPAPKQRAFAGELSMFARSRTDPAGAAEPVRPQEI